jgi:hypothetical protein
MPVLIESQILSSPVEVPARERRDYEDGVTVEPVVGCH